MSTVRRGSCRRRTSRAIRPVDPEMRARFEHDNCGFEKAELLPRNIGYIKFDYVRRSVASAAPTATSAMGFLANVDALIFDLRDNDGGDPAMVAFLASYLFAARTHLNDLYERQTNKTTEYWTKPELPGKKFTGKPVYVLTSSATFSGGEEFTLRPQEPEARDHRRRNDGRRRAPDRSASRRRSLRSSACRSRDR